ncbi:MAG TPA: hypothetical protein VGZ52_10270 [Acidimicrobiales bacterium]|jgi:hypothetical protein|nr:hypothetical protein [Acidimicrobiales bacterium]
MNATAVQVLTFAAVAVTIGLYVLFVVWRYRVDRRKKAAQNQVDASMSSAIARAAAIAGEPRSEPDIVALADRPTSDVAPNAPAPAAVPVASARTLADVLAGIKLPNELAPLTSIAPRLGVGDRVAFWTDTAPAEAVGTAFADELERLGYAVTPLNECSLAARRDDVTLSVMIHPEGRSAVIGNQTAFASVPEQAVVIEVWVVD